MARVTAPKEVEVGPYYYEVLMNATARIGLGSDFGDSDHDLLQIRINCDRSFQVQQEVMVHETLHAALNVCALDEMLGEDKSEDVVRRLAPVLTAILKKNPRWVAFVVAGK